MDAEPKTGNKVTDIETRREKWQPSYDQMRVITYRVLENWMANHTELAKLNSNQLNGLVHDESQPLQTRDHAAVALHIRFEWLRILNDSNNVDYPAQETFDVDKLTDEEMLFYMGNSEGLPVEDKFRNMAARRNLQLSFDQEPAVPANLPDKIRCKSQKKPFTRVK